jgi:molybdopterin molybdotransferase
MHIRIKDYVQCLHTTNRVDFITVFTHPLNFKSFSSFTTRIDHVTQESEPTAITAALKSIAQAVSAINETKALQVMQAGGHRLARDLISPINLPEAPLSAMDGFSFHSGCLDKFIGAPHIRLPVTGKSLAGHSLEGQATATSAVRIFTGAVVPSAHDTVIAQELVNAGATQSTIEFDPQSVKPNANVRTPGEDLKQGLVILERGTVIGAREIALLCSIGIDTVEVFRPTRVAVLSCGDELCETGSPRITGKIFDANRPMLIELIRNGFMHVEDLGIIEDKPDTLRTAVIRAADCADIVITSGGVSVGEADHTKAVLQSLGEIAFWKLAIKPGRPLAAGWVRNSQGEQIPFFGLPGNPVAAFVTFKAIVEPCLERVCGGNSTPRPPIRARLASDTRKAPGRTEFLRCALTRDANGEWLAEIAASQGAASIKSLVDADGLVVLPHDAGPLSAGTPVDVIVL